MSEPTIRDCTDPATWWPHLDEAVKLLARGGLVVLPTDTVYGIAADAFTARAVRQLLAAKGRGRRKPPPVLIGDPRTLDGLGTTIPDSVRALVERFWPGALTIIVRAQPTLSWDLGETKGTVALRMPDDEFTLTLLRKTGPLAVSSANLTAKPPALTVTDAAEQLGESVGLYLDGGPAQQGTASSIVDATGARLKLVREGALSIEELAEVAPELLEVDDEGEQPAEDGDGQDPAADEPAAEEHDSEQAIAREPGEP